MSWTGGLFKLARLSATGRAVRKGKLGKRVVNIAIGRAAARGLNRAYRR